jgi:hypothetical protein
MRNSAQSPVKVLSIGQPWAELILLIHASKKWDAGSAAFLGIRKDDVTFGALVGTADLKDIRRFTRADAALLYKKRGGNGNWEGGNFSWVLKSVHRIKPIRFSGQLGLFTPPARIRRNIEAELAAMKAARKKRA